MSQPEERRQQRRSDKRPRRTLRLHRQRPYDCYPAPGAPSPSPNPSTTAPRPIGDRTGSGGEKDSEGESQDMGVEAGRETGSRIGRNQRRPGDGRGHAKIDAQASLILRKCPEDIGHYHYQGGALRLSGRCPAPFADPCHRRTRAAGSQESHRPIRTAHRADPPSHQGPLRRRLELRLRSSWGRLPGHRQSRYKWIRIAGSEIISTRGGINTGTVSRSPDAAPKHESAAKSRQTPPRRVSTCARCGRSPPEFAASELYCWLSFK